MSRLQQVSQSTRPVAISQSRQSRVGSTASSSRPARGSGLIETAFTRPAFKVVLGPRSTLFLLDGNPSGGTVTQIDASGAVLRVIGTGKLSRHVDRSPIGRVGFLPSDVEPVGNSLLITQTEPIPAVRRLASGTGTLTTLIR